MNKNFLLLAVIEHNIMYNMMVSETLRGDKKLSKINR